MYKFFKYDFGFAAAIIYAVVVVLANVDKDVETMAWLAFRQGIVTFLTASTIVAYVIAVARSEKDKVRAYILGALVPAVFVATASFIAHWYFTNEYRNVLAPFVVSFILNVCAVTFASAGHTTLIAQLKYIVNQLRRRS